MLAMNEVVTVEACKAGLFAKRKTGIDVVRNRIKGFAQKKVTLPPSRHKIVILDEADSMTSGAQQALRRTMEIYSNTTRFAFACNQSNKIIEPLQSRCAILRYARLTDGQVVHRLMQIMEAETVEHSEDGLAALVFSAEGDMRQAINNLQSTWAGFGFVSGDNVFRVVDSPHPVKVQAMIKSCWEGRVDAALDTLKELWYGKPAPHLYQQYLHSKGSRVLVTRHNKHHVPSHQDHPHAFGTFQTRIHQRDWFYPHANPRRSPNVPPIKRLHCEALQDQHETTTFRTSRVTINFRQDAKNWDQLW